MNYHLSLESFVPLNHFLNTMDKLKQRGNQFSCVLNDSGADLFKSSRHIIHELKTQTDVIIVYCSCIYHDKDEMDDGSHDLKTPHYHLVVQTECNCQLSTFLKFLCNLFHCNDEQVSIQKCTSLEMQTRYLIHLDEIDKYHYSASDIVTDNEEFVKKCLDYIKSITCIDDLISIVRQYKNDLLKLMSVIGYDNYKKFRVVIADIRREILNLPIK